MKRHIPLAVRAAAFSALAVVLSFTTIHTAFAASTTANILKVTPVRTDIEIKPGASDVVKAQVTNLTKGDITVSPVANDFVAGDERGTPSLILDSDKFAPTHSLKRFMSKLTDVTIPANSTKEVAVKITVPKGTQAGGYFGAIRFMPTVPDSGGQVNLNASVASLILLTVPGDAVEKLNLVDFSVQQKGQTGTLFQSPEGLIATFKLENKGNFQEMPFGKISVTNGNKLVYETDFNNKSPKDTVLPDSSRRWDIPLNKIGKFGHYTVSATLTYGKKNQAIEVTRSLWVAPTGYIIAAAIAAGILLLLIVAAWWFMRGYKRRLLEKHTQGRGRF